MPLPPAEQLYEAFFRPWYPEAQTAQAYTGIRPDLEEIILPDDAHIEVIHPLPPDAREAPAMQVANMLSAAKQDWPGLLGVEGPIHESWLKAFDAHFSDARIEDLIKGSNPEQFSNAYLILCCEFGAVLGEVLMQQRKGLQWIYSWPYWDSALFDLNSHTRINVFHWGVKKLSAEGGSHTVEDKLQASLQFMQEGV